jgi:hypothetical protein
MADLKSEPDRNVSTDPSPYKGIASSDPTPFDWESALPYIFRSTYKSAHGEPLYDYTLSERVIIAQLAELLKFLRCLKIPAWLLKI